MIEVNMNLLRDSLLTMETNSYQNLCLLESSTVNPFATLLYEDIDINNIFKEGFNKNAKYVFFNHDDIKYIKFSLPINLNNKDDIKERKNDKHNLKYTTLEERTKLNRDSIELYLDGLKVPDCKVLITIYSAAIDVYIPSKYFLSEQPKLGIIVNRFNKKVINYTEYHSNSLYRSYNLLNLKGMDFKVENFRIYKNGYLVSSRVAEIKKFISDESSKKNYINITFSSDIQETDEIEFIYRHDTILKREELEKPNKIIGFDKDFLPNLPIRYDILEVYDNGKRLFNKDLTEITPRHVAINDYKTKDTVVTYVVYNGDAITSKNKYIDDITQFFNFRHEEASDILLGNYKGYVPDYIKYIKFPPEIIKVLNTNYIKKDNSFQEYTYKSIKEYIKMNVENFKYLLNNFSYSDEYYFNYENLDDYERLDTSKDSGINSYTFENPRIVFVINVQTTDKYKILFFSGNKKIPDENLYITRLRNKIFIYIERKYVENSESLHCLAIPQYNIYRSKEFSGVNEIEFKDTLFGKIRELDDLILMKRDGNGNILYYDGKVIYKDNKIIVSNLNKDDTYTLYNASFHSYTTYDLTEEDVNNETFSIKLDTYDKERGVYLPKLSNYSYFLFADGRRLIEDLDYIILSQNKRKDRNMCEVLFKTRFKEGTHIEVYFTEVYNQELGTVEYVNNKYGIVYFSDLIVPFDSGYLSLYVNGKLIPDDDIEVISSNIIKIYNVDNLIDISVKSKLNIPIKLLDEYTNTFVQNPSAWNEYIKKYWYNEGKIDDFYEDWKDIDREDIEEVPSNPDELPIRIDLLANEVANQLLKGLLPRHIDCRRYIDFSKNDRIRDLLNDDNDYIEINCSKNYLVSMCDIDSKKTMKTKGELIDALYEYTNNNPLDSSMIHSEECDIYKKMYQEDLDLIMSNSYIDK